MDLKEISFHCFGKELTIFFKAITEDKISLAVLVPSIFARMDCNIFGQLFGKSTFAISSNISSYIELISYHCSINKNIHQKWLLYDPGKGFKQVVLYNVLILLTDHKIGFLLFIDLHNPVVLHHCVKVSQSCLTDFNILFEFIIAYTMAFYI